MSLARKIIESRRKKVALGTGVAASNKKAWNDTGERLSGPKDEPQRWGTAGHKVSERASEMQKKHMVENRVDRHSEEHRRKRRIIHGGTHDNSYMPPETRGEL